MMPTMPPRTLTDLETRILDFAETHPIPLHPGDASAILDEFRWKSATYVQQLNRLMDDPAASRERPLLVHRLRRLRDDAVNRRAERRIS
jgi:hypothetical protein